MKQLESVTVVSAVKEIRKLKENSSGDSLGKVAQEALSALVYYASAGTQRMNEKCGEAGGVFQEEGTARSQA